PYTVRPHSSVELAVAVSPLHRRRMKDFNYMLSKQHISVEHAFGCLKLCFRSLQMMGAHANVDDVWRAIDALLIMHNMCLWYGDHPQSFEEYSDKLGDDRIREVQDEDHDTILSLSSMGAANIPRHETATWLKQQGIQFQKELLDIVCPLNNYD
ncbi:hypothetical protein GGX14DRAFT_377911, partial [Mycena pura]